MERFHQLSKGSPIFGLLKHEIPCHARSVQVMRQILGGVLMSCFALAACTNSAPEAGNQLITAAPETVETTAVVVASTLPPSTTVDTTIPASTSPPTSVFTPPSTTLPDDPDLREAIRVRVAVEAEYRRQARLGIADPAGFEGLADPATWLVPALADLEDRMATKVTTEARSLSGVVVYSTSRPKPDQILLDVCVFDDDFERQTQGTETEDDDLVSSGLDAARRTSVMVRKGGSWLFQGSVVSELDC